MRNLTRFLANFANQDLYDYQIRFFEELERRMEMKKVNDEILVKCSGTSQIDISPACLDFYQRPIGTSLAINTGGYDLKIRAMDYTIYDYGKAPGVPDIKRVIFSDLYTIVIWDDGTKTIVKCMDEKFDKEKGLAMCIAKKSLGNKGKYYDVFKKWIKESEEE